VLQTTKTRRDNDSFITIILLPLNDRFSPGPLGQDIGGLVVNKDWIFVGDYTELSGKEGADFFAHSDITALFCVGDLMAIGAIQGLKKYGIRVPEDISIVGFDNLPFTEYCSPGLPP
jgi:hypothetical protein